MSYWETIFFWISLVIDSIVAGGFIYAIAFKNSRPLSKLTLLTVFGFITHTVAICARYLATSHLPWAGDYESALMGGWFIIAATLIVGWKNQALQGLAAATTPLVIFLMGYGVMRNPTLSPMAASLKSFWLYIHVYFAWLSFGAYALAMATGVLYLLKRRNPANPAFDRFPSLGNLDELNLKVCRIRFHHRYHDDLGRRHLGEGPLGKLLDLGPGRNMVLDFLDHLRDCHPSTRYLRLATDAAGMARNCRPEHGHNLVFRRQFHCQQQPPYV